MSHIPSGSPVCTEFSGFDGVDTRKIHSGEPVSADIRNFRVGTNGTLEKRYGYRHLMTFPSAPRAFWHGYIAGEKKTYVLCEDTVYLVDLAAKSCEKISVVETTEGPADFFFYYNVLYLLDGKYIWSVNDRFVNRVFGYVPHHIKDRKTYARNEIYQPLNLLNRFARLSYRVTDVDPIPYLLVDHPIEQIEAVYLNGTRLSTEEYDYSTLLPSINIRDLKEGDEITAYVQYKGFATELDSLRSTTSAAVFGGISNSRVFLWDGNQKNVMFASGFVSREELKGSQGFYPTSDALYFPEHYEFSVGNGQYTIRAVARHFDRLLIFTEGDVWMANNEACGYEDFPTMNINSTVTCAAKNGAAILGNDPVSVGKHTLFRWTTETDEKNECNAYSLSAPIDSELCEQFFAKAVLYTDTGRGELWFHGRDEEGTVWIYSLPHSAWFRFTGIHADRFFDLDHEVAFFLGKELFCFDPSLLEDYGVDGTPIPIVASFQSGALDFGTDAKKKLDSFVLRADESDEVPTVRICADGLGEVVFPMGLHPTTANRAGNHTVRRHRLHSGRFHHATVTVTAEGAFPLRIHGLSLAAR